ncbi:MAG TPA: hypothetical protein VEI02_09780 [Planctomycetota bacterium]|nr:hypothetical protein [Planctomycetota bacterium]
MRRAPSQVFAAVFVGAVAAARAQDAATSAPSPASRPAAAAWVADLELLRTELPRRHVDAFARTAEADWRRAAEETSRRVLAECDADPEAAFVRLQAFTATLGDPHTTLAPKAGGLVPPATRLPAAAIWFREGLHFWALPLDRAGFLARPVTAIGGVPFDEAAARLATVFASDNASWRRKGVEDRVLDVATLRACGLCGADGATTFGVADADGDVETLRLAPPRNAAEAKAIRFARKPDFARFPPTNLVGRPPFGGRRLADSATAFVWYDACREDRPGALAAAIERLLGEFAAAQASGAAIDRLVVDLRRNLGGDSRLFRPFVDAYSDPKARPPGGLFVLVGRNTYSSGVINAWELKTRCGATLVGEPTGGALNGCGEIRSFDLPNVGATVFFSTKRFRFVEGEGRTLPPDVEVAVDAASFFAGRDPAFERAVR